MTPMDMPGPETAVEVETMLEEVDATEQPRPDATPEQTANLARYTHHLFGV